MGQYAQILDNHAYISPNLPNSTSEGEDCALLPRTWRRYSYNE